MAGESESGSQDMVLGFGAAWGFAPADQTSPALAGAAGALVDTTMYRETVTELRIHGVSGSNGPTMLEHPQALQVAGDPVAGFYRRWSPDGPGQPSVPRKLEAYSWGGLTEAPLASASWLLLAPFMMYNVAYFMLPPARDPGPEASGQAAEDSEAQPRPKRDGGHAIAHVVLRLLATAATVQFVTAAATALLSTVAWQAAGKTHSLLPGWMGWYGRWTAGWRVALATAAVGAIIAGLWLISIKTASKYEKQTSTWMPETPTTWPLTEPGFWRGRALVGRQRSLHAAAACASVALIVALPPGHDSAARPAAVILAGAVLAAAVVSLTLPLADRFTVSVVGQGRQRTAAKWWCRSVLMAGLAALVTSALTAGFTDQRPGKQHGALPGLTPFLAALLIAQAALLILLAVTVMVLAWRAPRAPVPADADHQRTGRPYLRGNLTTMVAALGFALGGLLTAVINFGMTRLLGATEPSGFRFGPVTPPPAAAPSDALAMPWPAYAFGAAPAGLLCGLLVAGAVLGLRYRRNCNAFSGRKTDPPSPVAAAYAVSTAGPHQPGDGGADGEAYTQNRMAIARAWAVGMIADGADVATGWVVGSSLALVLAAEIALAIYAGPAGRPQRLPAVWQGTASVVTLLVVLVAGGLVTLLRQAYSDPARRKTIGMLWDVGTFWPRAVHPLAPPCYAERAVPEVVDRIRLLTGRFTDDADDDVANLKFQAARPGLDRTEGLTVPFGKLLLTGYSQGSIIAPAVVAQLPPDVLSRVALLTLACPARRLYGRAFPAYFGQAQLTELARLLSPAASGGEPGLVRWRNLRRRSDYIGSWIFEEPEPDLTSGYLSQHIDQPGLDPVVLVRDLTPAPPVIHRHSQWWQDPRTSELGSYLIDQL